MEHKKISVNAVLSDSINQIEEILQKWVPRNVNEQSLKAIVGEQRYQCDVAALNKAIFEPIWDLLDRGGKRWRSTLLLLIAEALGKTREDVIDFVTITEIVHNGTLIIDDIEDNSDFRRGKPCLHKLVGVDVAVNAGNAMYFLPLRILAEKRNMIASDVLLQCYEVYSQEMVNLHIGQGLDIWWHNHTMSSSLSSEPSIDNYLLMCANKTGGLARMSCKLSALICGGSPSQVEALGKFAESIGIAFQIQDDLLNITEESTAVPSGNTTTSVADGKGGIGEDIHEGKRTIMVIHSLQNASAEKQQRLRELLSLKTNDVVLIKEAIDILKSTNSLEFAKKKAQELISSAWQDVDSCLPPSLAKDKLQALADFMISRSV